ncbi:MAG: hypothetical protein ACJ76D_04715 [Solirubrobacterales bacterium]
MKYIRILGLAAVAAMALMALIGAGTASATTICATGGSPEAGCGAGKGEYSGPVVAKSTNATLKTNITNVVCETSETTLNPSASTGTPSIPGEVSALSFTGCKTEGIAPISCTVTVRNVPYEGSIESNGGGLSTLRVKDSVGAGAKVVCGTILSCEFLTKEAVLSVKNGAPTVASASEVSLTRSGSICPETATWSADYNVTSPAGLTII